MSKFHIFSKKSKKNLIFRFSDARPKKIGFWALGTFLHVFVGPQIHRCVNPMENVPQTLSDTLSNFFLGRTLLVWPGPGPDPFGLAWGARVLGRTLLVWLGGPGSWAGPSWFPPVSPGLGGWGGGWGEIL